MPTPSSPQYAALRAQALRSCESRLQKLLFAAAKRIVQSSSAYRSGSRLTSETAFLNEARQTTAALTEQVEQAISQYSLAACRTLGIGDESVRSFLAADIYGKTSRQRTSAYLANFAEDVVRMSKAGILLGYTPDKILSAVRTAYRSPYVSSVITRARRYAIDIATPSYGKGLTAAAYKNLVRAAQGVIALAWGRAEQQYGQQSGATGFTSHRGSSFPCPVCDDETTYVHRFGDPYPPYHPRCVCFVRFIYPDTTPD